MCRAALVSHCFEWLNPLGLQIIPGDKGPFYLPVGIFIVIRHFTKCIIKVDTGVFLQVFF